MKARFLTIGCLAGILAIGGLVLWCQLNREPQHDGRPLSYWLDQTLSGEFGDGVLETFSALKAIGPPAARLLVRDLALTDTPLRRYYTRLRYKLPVSFNAVLPCTRMSSVGARANAFCALGSMGCEARQQVPDLVRLLKHRDKQVRIYAAQVLAGIGADSKPAIPALRRELEATLDPSLTNCFSQVITRIERANQTTPEQ